MIIPVVIGGLIVGAIAKFRKRKVTMSPERQRIYNAAINGGVKDPAKMEELAKAFKKEGLKEQATLLSQRARLMRLPEPVKQARRTAFRQALKSTNKKAILGMTEALDKEGCTTAAMRLREYASGLPDTVPSPTEAPQIVEETPPEDHAAEEAAGNNPTPPAEAAP